LPHTQALVNQASISSTFQQCVSTSLFCGVLHNLQPVVWECSELEGKDKDNLHHHMTL